MCVVDLRRAFEMTNFFSFMQTQINPKSSPHLELWIQVINLYSMVMPASEAPVFVDQVD